MDLTQAYTLGAATYALQSLGKGRLEIVQSVPATHPPSRMSKEVYIRGSVPNGGNYRRSLSTPVTGGSRVASNTTCARYSSYLYLPHSITRNRGLLRD